MSDWSDVGKVLDGTAGDRQAVLEIVAVEVRHGGRNEDITRYRWQKIPATDGGFGRVSTSSREEMLRWLEDGGVACVGSPSMGVQLASVHPPTGMRHIRCIRDGDPTNDLLGLPRFVWGGSRP